jgi:Domain of unknown function (DUF3395)
MAEMHSNLSDVDLPELQSNLLGFHDPCMGERKHLKVRYIFRNQLHEAIVDDVNPFAAPLRGESW